MPDGVVAPRVLSVPGGVVSSAGREAVELAAMAGLRLDPWQAFVMEHALGERRDGRWAAFEVGVEVPRQNGKGGILECRELAGLFLLGERLVIHSAHQFDTSLEAFRRLLALIEDTPELSRRVRRVSRAHGEEGIELVTKQRIRFRTRTKGGGRGFTGDCLILDEAMILPEAAHGALLPTLSARPNPQVWYTGSAVDREVHEHGLVFARVRERAVRGGGEGLAYFGWSAPAGKPGDVSAEMAGDRLVWRAANPALDHRIGVEHVAAEHRAMDPRTFAVERLGVGDWPSTDPDDDAVIDPRVWAGLEDVQSMMLDPVWFAVDVPPDRSAAAIGAAGVREDGLVHVELVDGRPGTGWVVDRVAELRARHDPAGVLVDSASAAASLAADLGAELVNAGGMARACGVLFDLVDQRRVRHLGDERLFAAVKGAKRRPLGDAWAWSRRSSAVDISPLVAVTLAAQPAASRAAESTYEHREMLVL